jgi:hypothetical protein
MLGFNVKRIFLRALSTFHPSLASVRAVEGKGADALSSYSISFRYNQRRSPKQATSVDSGIGCMC